MRVEVISAKGNYPAVLFKSQGKLALRPPQETPEGETLYLSAPWIDSHCHIFYGTTSFSLKPDDIGLKTGVHLLVDAGSVGAETLRAFTEYVVPEAKTKIRAFLNVSSIGLVTKQEYFDLRLVDPGRAAEAIIANQPLLCGIKVRSSAIIVEDRGLEPFRRAIAAAEMAGCPLMVHIGEHPPTNAENLPLFRAGDILTHCFHGKEMPLWNPDGTPIPEMERALARGMVLDVGHGAASFDANIAGPVLRQGFADFSISTDLHARSIKAPAISLAATMTKFLALGMPLTSVIRSVTEIPAERLGLRGWCDNQAQNGTVFRLRAAKPSECFTDAARHTLAVEQVVEPVGVIVDGEWMAIDRNIGAPKAEDVI